MDSINLQYEFSADKNQRLIQERAISVEHVISAIDNGKLLEIINHPNAEKYPGQQIYIVEMNNYVYLVPFVKKDAQTIFLKTIFPSRKLTKIYLSRGGER